MALTRFRVWTTSNLYAPYTFTEVKKCNVRNLRWENKGLGACQIDVDLRHYDDNVKQTFLDGNGSADISNTNPGTYIFIQDTGRIVKPTDQEILLGEAVDPDSADYTLPSPADVSVIWWGYISARNYEVQAKSNDVKGSLDCLQIGHCVNKFKIRFPKEIRNGFNPEVDGRILGNKKPSAQTFLTNPNDFATDPLVETSKYWTVRQVVDYTVIYGTPFQVTTDWSLLEDSMVVDAPNRWLEQYEQIPSYENEDLTSALEDILDTLGWVYEFSSDEELFIKFFDPIGNMSDEYIDTYNIPRNAKQFSITSEEQSYEKIVLRGNRILVAGSVSTYGEWDSLKLTKSWTDDEQYTYINPLETGYNYNTLDATIDLTKENEAIDNDDGLSDEAKEQAKADALTNAKNKVFEKIKVARELLPNVYQHFKWNMGDTETPTISGNCLYTNSFVGNWKQEKDMQNATTAKERAIPFFPRLFFQDSNTTKDVSVPTGELDLLGEPIVEIVKIPKNIDELVYSDPIISDERAFHQTPIASEMVFEDTIPWKPYEKENEWYNKPRFYYRTFGPAEDFSGTIVYDEAWQYGDLTGDGLMSSEFTLDWQGIKLKSPQPECFAWNSNCIFQQGAVDVAEYDTTVEKFGITTGEWTNSFAISNYDPYRVYYAHKGHWSRMIFSFAARSNQRLELSYGDLTSTDKIKFEEDESLELWIIRKGFVPYLSKDDGYGGGAIKVPGLPLPKWEQSDTIARNDISKAKDRLKTLWNFWSKPKRAVQIILPTFDASGNIYDPGVTIGSFLDTVTDSLSNDTEWEVNSYVSSIEMNLESMSPNITIATEYPASPRRTREKRLMSANKFIRFGKAPSNRGEK